MKTKNYILFFAFVFIFFGFTKNSTPQIESENTTSYRTIDHHAFKNGEKLEYRLHYGVINAGTAKLEVKKFEKKISGRDVYHIVGSGKTKGAFDWFFKVRDRYE